MKQKKTEKAIEVRLYKSHDADLLALRADGYNVSKLLKEAVENYVAGTPVKYRLSGCTAHELDDIGGVVRYHLRLSNEAARLVRRTRRGRRNQFVKTLLRDMLESEPLGGYFTNTQDTEDAVRWLKAQENAQVKDLDEKKRKNAPAQKHKKADIEKRKEIKETEPITQQAEFDQTTDGFVKREDLKPKEAEKISAENFVKDSAENQSMAAERKPEQDISSAPPHRRFAELPVETVDPENEEAGEKPEEKQPEKESQADAGDTTKYREQTLLNMFDNMMEEF